ncbi:hypothetical protein Q5M87_10745 [Brachyspira innocens]|uniref:Uncharacterized protein n=1 Tax=Brachyspira innocens TaxID=13264 RepID=A0ABT8Z2I4_9SPIR|nr:hypothetical protein [Brachyspira innocens]MDO6994484.1 hypothetical protein [Brachyspira innocens]MDO7021605.1 hypothetical protein [Brachyspira innocens]
MLKVFNKIKFVLLGYALISACLFAQGTDTWTLDNSAVKRATAGQFSTDSDKVKSKDIFDLQRAFFSAGYLGGGSFSQNGGGTADITPTTFNSGVQGAFGIPFANGMYLGFAARYQFNDSADITKDKNGNVSDLTPNNLWTINSKVALRAALRISETIAVHYYFGLQPNTGTGPSIYSLDKVIDKNTKADYSMIANNGVWTHEIAASIKFGEHKLTIPVGIVFHADNQKQKGTYGDNIEGNAVSYGNNDYISLYLNPEFNLALAAGPMTGITVGANLEFGVNNNFGQNGSYTANSTETKYEGKQGKDRFDGDIYASFPLSWSLANDQVKLAMEPKLSLGLVVTNTGNDYQKIGNGQTTGRAGYRSDVRFVPYAELPIGTTWQPVEWWQLRAGTALMIQAEAAWITQVPAKADGSLDESLKTVNTSLTTKAGIAGFFGMGFIVGEDFNIDLFAEVSTLSVNNLNFGGQLTYRFN